MQRSLVDLQNTAQFSASHMLICMHFQPQPHNTYTRHTTHTHDTQHTHTTHKQAHTTHKQAHMYAPHPAHVYTHTIKQAHTQTNTQTCTPTTLPRTTVITCISVNWSIL